MPRLTPEIMSELLPPSFPDLVLPDGVSRPSAGQRLEELDPLRRMAFAWSAVLQAEAERERYDTRYAGFRFATFGFIPLLSEHPVPPPVRAVGGYVFGTAIELGPHRETAAVQLVEPLAVQGRPFALVVNRRRYDLHVANPIYPPGTGACWARSSRAMLPGVAPDGVLTAEHVVSGTTLGSSVAMTAPGAWQLADSGDCKIDAALVTVSGAIPPAANPLIVETAPSPGTDVEILGNASPGPVTGTITHTMIFPTYLSTLHPMRVFLDMRGIGGDSGALVREKATGRGVAIYMGATTATHTAPGGGVVEGISQYLEQARDALDLTLSL